MKKRLKRNSVTKCFALIWAALLSCPGLALAFEEDVCRRVQYNFSSYEVDPKYSEAIEQAIKLYNKGEIELAIEAAEMYSGRAMLISRFFAAGIKKVEGIEHPFSLVFRGKSYSYSDRTTSMYAALDHSLGTLADGFIYHIYGEGANVSTQDIINHWINDPKPNHLLYAAQVGATAYGTYSASRPDQVNYQSAWAHLTYYKSLGIEGLSPYIQMADKAINNLPIDVRDKKLKLREKYLRGLFDCNTNL